jgi:hypothetical protein
MLHQLIIAALGPLKDGFAAAQKSFSLLVSLHVIMINNLTFRSISERRKTFDSPHANHLSLLRKTPGPCLISNEKSTY